MKYSEIKKLAEDRNKNKGLLTTPLAIAQAGQDVFAMVVAEVTNNKTYLEVGAKLPYMYSNTNYLEFEGWDGTSIELRTVFKKDWKSSIRDENRVEWTDALKFDYTKLPKEMGFLSCDIDPPLNLNIKVLTKILESGMKFDSICYEHNRYIPNQQKHENERKEQQDALLIPAGYRKVVEDAYAYYDPAMPFEDWWVHDSIDFPIMTFVEFVETYSHLFEKVLTRK
jgi:hypothetical protein